METQIKAQTTNKIKTTEGLKISPFLWFDTQAEQAANFYTGIFNDSKINSVAWYGAEGAAASGMAQGSVMTVGFTLEGQDFTALNGGKQFELSPAISFLINADDEQEIKTLWEKLSQGGTILMDLKKYPFSDQFGRLKDQFGVTWLFVVGTAMQKITPFLMFTGKQYGKAEEAMNFYTSLFDHSGIIHLERYGPAEEEFEGTVKHARFSINEQEFIATDSNTGNELSFTPALSFVIKCETQQEIDHFWDHLTQGGDDQAQQCGWLQDKYGISWQIVPFALDKMVSDPDIAKAERVMKAMIPMKKLNLQTLTDAYEKESF
jgi:predicted 3-demethylubiquinone-9 3-methyltransferase (glyoxalase superfamily)